MVLADTLATLECSIMNDLSQQQDTHEFIHTIDNKGRICFVNHAWINFAAENGWSVSTEEIIGSNLMANIVDPETRHIYNLLINRAREEGQNARFDYRCDSPDCHRLMEMRIYHNQDSDEVEFRSRIISSVKREPIALIDPTHKHRSDEILKMCSWCKSVWDENTWIELERAVKQLGIMTDQVLPRISHGICNECSNRMTRMIENL